jgi:putative nucleotidyltransferase with HDIG domain
MTLYLKKIFLHVDSAEDGEEGLEKFKQSEYDLVLSDISMPKMDGVEMIKAIKTIKADQEIVIISAYSDSRYLIDAIALGVSEYILKPIDYDRMNDVLYKCATRLQRFNENIMYKTRLEEMVKERTEAMMQLEEEKIQNFEQTLLAFIELIEDRDTYTGGHSQRVANYCRLIALEMGQSEQVCDLLYRAGILHDIGKVATPDTVLLKPGQLNELEYKLIQEHVKIGYELLCKIPMYKEISKIIYAHHERYDGAGYPNGLKGDEISLLSHIMIIADAFDAMTTNRIYKGRKEISGAIEEIKLLSGKQFHPDVVTYALKVFARITSLDLTTQTPQTEIERERFAYYYRDQITKAYNADYLSYILNRNGYTAEYTCINALYLHNFTQYNQELGWSEGNKALGDFVEHLLAHYPDALIFRVHGDDFVLVSKEHLEVNMQQFSELKMFTEHHVSISKQYINLRDEEVTTLAELEALLLQYERFE